MRWINASCALIALGAVATGSIVLSVVRFGLKDGMIEEIRVVLVNLPDAEPTNRPAELRPLRGGRPVE